MLRGLNNVSIFSGLRDSLSGGNVAPTRIADLQLWLDAADTATITDTTNLVDQIDDKSGNANHATATTTLRPTTNFDAFNDDKNALRFNGSNYMLANGIAGIMNGVNQPISIAASSVINSTVGTQYICSFGSAVSDVYFGIYHSGGQLYVTKNAGGDPSVSSAFASVTPYQPISVVVTMSSTTLKAFVNGILVLQQASLNVGSVTYTKFTVGALNHATISDHITGNVNEISVYDRVLTEREARTLSRSLASKWNEKAFVATWKTDNLGTSASNQITIPTESIGTYNMVIDWGDGTRNTITTWNDPALTHTYAAGAGTYPVRIKGLIKGFKFDNGGDKEKLLNIYNWGRIKFATTFSVFFGCSNLTVTARDILDVSYVLNFSNFFLNCVSLTTIPNINLWDTSQGTNMRFMFRGCTNFNDSIGDWNTSKVARTDGMFISCLAFNQPLNNWDMSSNTDMNNMFQGCSVFNQPLNSWNVSKVLLMNNMFISCTAFNQDLSSWNVSNVINFLNFLNGSGFTQTNYDPLLIAWSALPLKPSLNIHFGTAKYGAGAPATARADIIANYSWTITDGGVAP